MDMTQFQLFINQSESDSLDFKQELKIYGMGEGSRRERDELCRDILALTNGNPRVAGVNKHLIIGRADKPKSDGTYELFNVGGQCPTADDLLKMLANVAYPSLNHISSELVEVDGKRLLVITIPPTEYVHETTRELKTPKRTYTERTVFMRRDESIVIASASDRNAIRRAKQKYFDERKDVPPVPFAAAVGALLVGPVVANYGRKQLGYSSGVQTIFNVVGSLIGALMGSIIGRTYEDFFQMKEEWPALSTRQKGFVVSGMMLITAMVSALWNRLFGQNKSKEQMSK